MRRRSLPAMVSLVSAASLACSTQAPVAGAPSTSPPPALVVEADPGAGVGVSGEVLVPHDAWLYAAPGSAIRFRYRADDAQLGSYAVLRFTIVADHGEWLELEAGPEPEPPARACVPASAALRAHGVRVFVARSELAPLTTRVVEASFDDGTGLRVRPGTPVGPARPGDGWRSIETEEARFDAPIPADAIGLSFADWGPAPRPYGDTELNPAPHLELAGGERLHLAVDEYGFIYNYAITQLGLTEDGRPRLELDAACFTAVVVADPGDVRPPSVWGSGGLGLIGTGAAVWYDVGEGANVYWADGSVAGRRRAAFSTSAAPTERGDLRCFVAQLGNNGPVRERSFELCYASADVQVRPPTDVGGP